MSPYRPSPDCTRTRRAPPSVSSRLVIATTAYILPVLIQDERVRVLRARGCLTLVIAPPPTALVLNKHDLVSHPAAVAAASHSAAVAAVIRHLFLRSYKTSAASSRLAAAVYHRLCPHSSNLSAGSSFPTVSARACTKRARPRLYHKCEVPALRTRPLYIQYRLLKQKGVTGISWS
ncbi:hypothetical protein HETIRDRAFT_455729 [Heterobasidion irregulare TC 32-1]|uniref:Uncharacterized protein n=1 Tax=Heterobasidion irregulare (strain TC 32-1) TaxID=747525 RepID=W4JSV6_HETIT|nr:uncharacterized protein HETIRDRAFT_455729 [Heterobasidion irregulare TC 32-1]ETW76190.1 hypothetical protein HETIRDRAFT_455729 [Heterobasidion irregulare TC 32-1]